VSDTTSPDPSPDEPVSEPAPAAVTAEPAVTPVPVTPEETGYTAGGVPTFDYVREKIETSFGTSIGAAELASETPEGRRVEEQYEARQKAAADRLAQIRESMKNEQS
jgi:phage shock protein A